MVQSYIQSGRREPIQILPVDYHRNAFYGSFQNIYLKIFCDVTCPCKTTPRGRKKPREIYCKTFQISSLRNNYVIDVPEKGFDETVSFTNSWPKNR